MISEEQFTGGSQLAPSKQEIQTTYQRHARRYDFYVRLYALLGFRYNAYRSRAIRLLHLSKGNCVVDLGCGTGLNFPLVEEQIGEEGRLIGVDLSSQMLACADQRAHRAGWTNVELVQSDMVSGVGYMSHPERHHCPLLDTASQRPGRTLRKSMCNYRVEGVSQKLMQ